MAVVSFLVQSIVATSIDTTGGTLPSLRNVRKILYVIEMEAIGCDGNHIHLRCGAHPKLAPGKIVQIFKSLTAREVFRRKPSAKKELWGGEFWSDGYYVGPVRKHADWDTVEKFVRNQSHGKSEIADLRQLKLFNL